LAVASKYSAVFLFAVVPIAWIAVRVRSRSASWTRACVQAAAVTSALAATTFIVVWALYGFVSTPPLPPAASPILPAPITGLLFQIDHQRGGHFAYLLGQLSALGWWYYTPVVLLLKSTPAELVVFGACAYALCRGWRKCSTGTLVARTAFLVFLAGAFASRVDAGVRYILLLYPLAALIAAEPWSSSPLRRSRAFAAAAVLVLLQTASAVRIAPHYLSYFNLFVGGPAAGHRYLADSNIDWGQDLPALRKAFARAGAVRPILAYFGTAPIQAYGVRAAPFGWGHPTPDEPYDWVAVSATYLDGVYVGDSFSAFRSLVPADRAGYSIFLYDGRRPDVQRAVRETVERQR
jgi:hypothetical protein